ncbi:YjdF family protein [Pseudobacteroides cellulosolvens]|uniref:Putative conserved protein UCP021328 n=1 Tax=Pseudobacteroides cellulosolvens ATCC 35603 = DSM 2933 TaxID=398512 RepID=A0A0L6JV66_9FIRM|nr:YjdF family protein [Pseudobacteroides cellulosolvens]KNY29317.1 putative conserved protein UCP021328 [Pseudobacteroides cellulosolvens ATCC 35603 = DSM 2933]
MHIKLTVFFEEPFWVGVFERVEDGMLETSKVVFGAEPKDYEVYFYLLKNYSKLVFSRPIEIDSREEKKINPKRLHRIVKKEMAKTGVGTKAQQVMKLEHELKKVERKQTSKEKKEELKQIKFEMKQEKKKEKKKGH